MISTHPQRGTHAARRLDPATLHAALDAERRARGLTWRQIADRTGVSAATIARMPQGARMEVDGVLFLLQWLDLPIDAFLSGPGGAPPDLLTQVATLLRAQPDLTPEAATTLLEFIRDAYDRLRLPPA